MKNVYVDVICLNEKDGRILPLYLIWKDQVRIPILKVTEIKQGSSLKEAGSGLQYTCIFHDNRVRHLYYDRGRWYVKS